MSATTLNLPYTRFVAQVSTAPARSKSTYLALMEENLAALQKCPWKEAADVPAALADHDFTASTHLSSAYDAFKMTGNYSASTMTEIAYAGMAAYRFKIPDSASAVALSSISIPVSRDRYLKSGIRVAAVLSDSATPSADWDVVRGSGGILLSAQLPQSAAYLLAGAPGKDELELAASTFPGLAETGHAYLWIYLTLEDYTEHWDMYSANEQRLYAIEGSAMLVGGSAEFTFAGEVAPDTPSAAAETRLITTGYPASSALIGAINPTVRAHRVFSDYNTGGWIVFVGENSTTPDDSVAPMLNIITQNASGGFSTTATLTFPDGYCGIDTATGQPINDIAALWYDTVPGKACHDGVGITGVFIAPQGDNASVIPPTTGSFRYLWLYISTKEGLYRCGVIKQTAANVLTFEPRVTQIGDGGDLLLVRKVIGVTDPLNDTNILYEYTAECVSYDDGLIKVGSRSIAYEGSITGLGNYDGYGTGIFLVAGNLKSIGGVACKHIAKIDTRNDKLLVEPLSAIDDFLVPNCYDDFRVTYANGKYNVIGSFTLLGGVACVYGAAEVTAEGVSAANSYFTDVVRVNRYSNESTLATIVAERMAVDM